MGWCKTHWGNEVSTAPCTACQLEALLRQAQKERDRAVRELVAEVGKGREWDEQYDAAIEREGEQRRRRIEAERRVRQLEAEHQAMQDSAKPAARRTFLSGRQAR